MQVDPEFAQLIHPDASALLRPRTGLQDMTIELDAGTEPGEIPEGFTIPLANSAPNINPDQILASLDGDTRAYLRLLLAGGAEASRHAARRARTSPRCCAGSIRRPRHREDQRRDRQAARQPPPRDHQLQADRRGAGEVGHEPDRLRRVPERGLRRLRRVRGEPPRDAPGAAGRPAGDPRRAQRSGDAVGPAQAGAHRPAAAGARARPGAAGDCGRSSARPSRRSATQIRPFTQKVDTIDRRPAPRRGPAQASPRTSSRAGSPSSTSSSTRSPTTRPAATRATSST